MVPRRAPTSPGELPGFELRARPREPPPDQSTDHAALNAGGEHAEGAESQGWSVAAFLTHNLAGCSKMPLMGRRGPTRSAPAHPSKKNRWWVDLALPLRTPRHMHKLILSGLFLGLACSSDDTAPQTVSSFCEQWAEGACSGQVVSACQAADANDCRASQIALCLDMLPSEGFAGSQAEQCLSAVRSAYADADLTADELGTVLRLGAPCDRLVSGPGGGGAMCNSRLDCDAPEGLDCVFKGEDTSGTCQVPTEVGAGLDCSAVNAVCAEGFFCDGENCIGGQSPGEACTVNRECNDGYCSAGTCVASLAVDTPCTSDEQCASGLCYQFSATEQVCTDRVRLSRSEPMCEDLR